MYRNTFVVIFRISVVQHFKH